MKNIAFSPFDISGRCARIVPAACLLGAMLTGCASPAARDPRDAAMLIGIAIAEGRIRSVDDPAAAYVPALAETEYGRTGQPQPGTGGYGYQVWILAGEPRMFALRGVRGEAIYVDPSNRLVMVHTAVRQQARDIAGIRETNALWRSVVQQLGN